MFKKKIPLRCTSSGHYHIPITKPLPDKSKFKHILFIKEISSKNKSEKIKIATKLHRQFSHPCHKKLCDWIRNAGIQDPKFIKILQVLPNSCKVCICYKKTDGFPLGSCPVGWGCRIQWLHLWIPTSVLDMTLNNLMVRFQQCWSFWKCRVHLHCHHSQVHSSPEW